MLVHVVTKKGKGYEPAENHPKEFHGIGKFDIDTGEPLSSHKGFSAVFGKQILQPSEKGQKDLRNYRCYDARNGSFQVFKEIQKSFL